MSRAGYVVFGGVAMTVDAAATARAVGLNDRDVAEELERVRSGRWTEADLREDCARHAEGDAVAGWESYCDAIVLAASK